MTHLYSDRQGSRVRTWGLGIPFLPVQRAAFFPASSPAALQGHEGQDARAAMMPCNLCAAAALLPTMSPFMRAGMKCEALGINSATKLPALQWPRASEQCLDGHRSQGGHTSCSLGVRLFICHHSG